MNVDSESLATLLYGTTVAILWRTLQKQLEAYKVGHWKFSHLKFSIFSAEIPGSKKKRAGVGTKVSVLPGGAPLSTISLYVLQGSVKTASGLQMRPCENRSEEVTTTNWSAERVPTSA